MAGPKNLPAGVLGPSGDLSPGEAKYMTTGGDGSIPGDTATRAAPETVEAEVVRETPERVPAVREPAGARPARRETPAAEPDGGRSAARVGAAEEEPLEEEPGAGDRQQRMVPHGALHEEREMRKAADKRAEKAEERFALVFAKIQEMTAPKAPAAEAPKPVVVPEFEADPLGHVKGSIDVLSQAVQTLLSREIAQDGQTTQADKGRQLQTWAAQQEREFVATHPGATDAEKWAEHNAAVAHMAKALERHFARLGHPAEQLPALINAETWRMAARCQEVGKNPAQAAYELAQEFGYVPGARPTAEGARPTAAAALEVVRQGQERAGGGLSTVRGRGPDTMTAQKALEMTDADFARVMMDPDLMGR